MNGGNGGSTPSFAYKLNPSSAMEDRPKHREKSSTYYLGSVCCQGDQGRRCLAAVETAGVGLGASAAMAVEGMLYIILLSC